MVLKNIWVYCTFNLGYCRLLSHSADCFPSKTSLWILNSTQMLISSLHDLYILSSITQLPNYVLACKSTQLRPYISNYNMAAFAAFLIVELALEESSSADLHLLSIGRQGLCRRFLRELSKFTTLSSVNEKDDVRCNK